MKKQSGDQSERMAQSGSHPERSGNLGDGLGDGELGVFGVSNGRYLPPMPAHSPE